jgi:general L-amino acid transport system substrate-binding protein
MDAIVKKLSICAALAMIVACVATHAAEPLAVRQTTLARVRAAGVLRCGIDQEEAEYTTSDDHGNREAFDADLCRAVAVAVLGKDARVQATRFPDDQTAMTALKKGDLDLAATLPDDFSHAVGTHLEFTRPVLWDGVGFLLPDGSKVEHAWQLSGKKICFLAETAVEEAVRAWFVREHLNFIPFPFQEEGEMQAAFATGNCGALAGEATRLAETHMAFEHRGHHQRLLPERISADPLAAAVREDDPQWAAIVRWVMEVLVAAEESGVTKANVEAMRKRADSDPALRFLLGGSREIGSALGLDNDWVARVIAATGNYAEIYERDIGSGSPLKLPRGENNLREHGGVMMALPTH